MKRKKFDKKDYKGAIKSTIPTAIGEDKKVGKSRCKFVKSTEGNTKYTNIIMSPRS